MKKKLKDWIAQKRVIFQSQLNGAQTANNTVLIHRVSAKLELLDELENFVDSLEECDSGK